MQNGLQMIIRNEIMEYLDESPSFDKKEFLDAFLQNYSKNEAAFVGQTQEAPVELYEEIVPDEATLQQIEICRRLVDRLEKNTLNEHDNAPIELPRGQIDYQTDLNRAQQLAVTINDRPLLVIAGAGSGKTRTIVYKVSYLIENKAEPSRILLLTFTRKAAQEMLERCDSLLDKNVSDKIAGGTFHTFALRMLRQHAGLTGLAPNFNIADTVDAQDILTLIREEMLKTQDSEGGGQKQMLPKGELLLEIISRSRNTAQKLRTVIENHYPKQAPYIEQIETIEETYALYKQEHRLLDYDDLIITLRNDMRDSLTFRKRIQTRFDYILVDEYQDTNIIQREIVEFLAEHNPRLTIVGDDSQSIYSFRGANFENILRFAQTFPGGAVVKIQQNYRSQQRLLDFSNSIITSIRLGCKKQLYSAIPPGAQPVVKPFYDQRDEAVYIAEAIFDLVEAGKALKDIAVLYRSTYHGQYVQTELMRRNIPFVVVGGLRFIERKHVRDVVAHLRVLHNALDAPAWNRILKLIPGLGSAGAKSVIAHIRSRNGQIDFSSYQQKKYYEALKKLAQTLTACLTDEKSLREKVALFNAYYAELTKHILDDFELRMADLDILTDYAGRFADLEEFLSTFALDPPSNNLVAGTKNTHTEKDVVVLSTVHSAKGLEWRTVFVIHALDGLFPDRKALNSFELTEEERRLFYVACTRAKEELHITYPSYVSFYNAFFAKPSRFLKEIDPSTYQRIE